MKRKLFSKKDGTTFIEDVKDISEEVKNFFNSLPPKIKKWIAEAETIVEFLERIEEAFESQELEAALEFVFAQIKGDRDKEIFEAIKKAIHDLTFGLDEWHDKFEIATEALTTLTGDELNQIEIDTTTQVAVYMYKV